MPIRQRKICATLKTNLFSTFWYATSLRERQRPPEHHPLQMRCRALWPSLQCNAEASCLWHTRNAHSQKRRTKSKAIGCMHSFAKNLAKIYQQTWKKGDLQMLRFWSFPDLPGCDGIGKQRSIVNVVSKFGANLNVLKIINKQYKTASYSPRAYPSSEIDSILNSKRRSSRARLALFVCLSSF